MSGYNQEENQQDELCAQNIRYLRMLHELPQRYLAKKLGISQVAYCRIEKGELRVTKSVQEKLSLLYGCSASVLLHADIRELMTDRLKNLQIDNNEEPKD